MKGKANPLLSIDRFAKSSFSESGFYVKTFQEHRHQHPFVSEPHSHDFYMLMIFTKGTGTHQIEFTEYSVAPGSVFFMAPGESHSWKLSDDSDGFVLFFTASFFFVDALPHRLYQLPFFRGGQSRHLPLSAEELSTVSSLCDLLLKVSLEEASYRREVCRAFLDALLYELAGYFHQTEMEGTSTPAILTKLNELIENFYLEHVTSTFYAEKLSISQSRLNEILRLSVHKTLKELIRDRLIAEAKRLLAYSDQSVAEIAYSLNFTDDSNFNKYFRKAAGISPDRFRKQFRIP
jgi:AraC-like DNA-binding protein